MPDLDETAKLSAFDVLFVFKQTNVRALGITRPLQAMPKEFFQKFARNVASLRERRQGRASMFKVIPR